jgi:hypothetical protein
MLCAFLYWRNFTVVGKNIGHLLDKIGRWKNRRYPTKNTSRYQIGGDSTKLGRASTKICGDKIYFPIYILFLNKDKSVIFVLSFKIKNSICCSNSRVSLGYVSSNSEMSDCALAKNHSVKTPASHRVSSSSVRRLVFFFPTISPYSLELISQIINHSALFFSYNKSVNSTFSHGLLAKQTWRLYDRLWITNTL